MPRNLLERLPLPSLHTYISLSVLMLALACFYAHQTVRTKLDFDAKTPEMETLGLPPELQNITLPFGNDEHFLNMLHVMTVEYWCIWTLVNSCYCLLILLARFIQNIVFGELRVSEQQHLKDKFWNFIFYKFIFIFGVMNVQSMDQVVLWVAWFTALGFFHLLTQLCKDRFEYLSFSPATPWISHMKLLSLLVVILISCGVLIAVCVWVGLNISFTLFAFLAAESLLLSLKCLYVVLRYVIQLREMNMEGVWEGRAVYVYYLELVFDLVSLTVDFSHHLHMLLYGNIFLSMASLVICMQLRYLFYEFQRRIKRHKNYLRVVRDMEAKFPMATQEDLEVNADDCAICWEKMEIARKLPCGHLFHNSCLRSWLEQDTSCPTCRTPLSEQPQERRSPADAAPPANAMDGIVVPPNQGTTNHFFHFDGSRYVSWLPSFSVEVTHTNILPGQQAHATQTSQLDNMAREVQTVFPNMPLNTIMEDLRVTRSVDLTIDNILEGRLTMPPSISQTASLGSSESSQSDFQVAVLPNLSQNDSQPSSTSSEAGETSRENMSTNASLGGRFSKSATERMTMLEQRKQAMMESAKRRFVARQQKLASSASGSQLEGTSEEADSASIQESSSSEGSSSEACAADVETNAHPAQEDELVRRRELLLRATQRRLGGDLN